MTTTQDEALCFAVKIEKYWKDRGHQVRIDLVPIRGANGRYHYEIASDTINGLPRDFFEKPKDDRSLPQ